MTTKLQMAANTANAKLGGVKTPEGKAIVRLNAVTHGLTSKQILLRGENREELELLRADVMSELQPQGVLETLMADSIASDIWRLGRCARFERDYLQGVIDFEGEKVDRANDRELNSPGALPSKLAPWKAVIRQEMGDGGGLSKSDRYRTAIERHIYRSLKELREMQAARLDRNLPAIDADGSSDN